MAAIDINTVPKIYKDIFGGKAISMATKGKPMLNRITKLDDLEGFQTHFPWRVHAHPGASHTFANAQSDDTANDVLRPVISPKNTYQAIDFDAKALAASRSNVGSYLRLKAKETQEGLEYMGQKLEREIWRGAYLGQPTGAPSNVAGAVYKFTVAKTSDLINFVKGQKIGAWTTSSGAGAQRAETAVVTKVLVKTNEVHGTFTGNPATWASTDFIFVEGDRNTTDTLGLTSIADYIPSADPSSGESFKGVDRSGFPELFAGWRGDTYGTVEESIQQLAVRMAPFTNALQFGGTEVWLHAQDWQRLNAEAGARLLRDQGGTAIMGFKGFRIATAAGDFPVMSGPYVPQGTAWLLDQSTWELHTLRELIHLVDEDGQEMLRKASTDSFEMRWRSWSELFCNAPIRNGRVTL